MSVNCLSQFSMVSPHSLQWVTPIFNGSSMVSIFKGPPPTLPPSPSPSPSPLPDRRCYHWALPWPPPLATAVPTRPLSLASANPIVSRHHRRRRCHPASAAVSAAALGLASLPHVRVSPICLRCKDCPACHAQDLCSYIVPLNDLCM